MIQAMLTLAFLAICALTSEVLVRKRRGEAGLSPPGQRVAY